MTQEIIIDNIKYYLNTKIQIAKVIDYQNEPIDVIIPESVEYKSKKYKVTEIRYYAFSNCHSLTSITIPNSVTYIGYMAFYHCSSLKSISIPNSITIIESGVFEGSGLKSITIPNSVTSIGYKAFRNCSSLTSITIPDSVTKIGNHAFHNIGLTLPKRYTEDGRLIAYKAFNADMTCRDFQYEEGKTYELEGEIECCYCGFHACTNPLDVFNYYCGEIGNNIYIHEVYLSGDIDEDNNGYNSSVCASKIDIGRRLTIKDINDIINSK